MTVTTLLLGRGALFCLLCFLAGCFWGLFKTPQSRGRIAFRRYEQSLNRDLRFLRAQLTGRSLALAQVFASVALIVVALLIQAWVALCILPLIFLFPRLILTKNVARRTSLFDQQIEPWLAAISNALKASPSLGEAIASTTDLVPAPMCEEVDVLVKEYQLGTPLDRALSQMAERIDSSTLGGAVLALKVARRSGGNLPEMLDNAADALRELARLEGVVRTKTAEGKAQATVIAAIPLPMVGLLHWMDPHFFDPLFHSFVGTLIMILAGILWLLAVVSARRILSVDV